MRKNINLVDFLKFRIQLLFFSRNNLSSAKEPYCDRKSPYGWPHNLNKLIVWQFIDELDLVHLVHLVADHSLCRLSTNYN